MPYAEAQDMIDRFDSRLLGDLVQDANTQAGEVALLSNRKMMAALGDASGEVDAAIMVGAQYTPEQLAGLTGNSLSHLKRITCDIALARLIERRPGMAMEVSERILTRAQKHLESLRKGLNVFVTDTTASGEGSLPTVSFIDLPTLQNMNLIRDRTNHYYPVRRLPGRSM